MATKARTQKPNTTANGTDGPVSNTYFDGAGRAVKTTNSVNGAHTEWVYDPSQTLVKTYTTVSDDSLADPALRHYNATALDGLGRVLGTAGNFTGSETVTPAGNYSAQIIHYDASGRAAFRSNPTEMRIANGEWTPAGDDANGGLWKGTTQEYDWKGRPTKIINPDGTNRLFEYGGCGCAGGEVVTVRGELVPTNEPAPAPAQARRTRKVYHDVMGRAVREELLKWDAATVYSTTTTKYDALDRPVRVRQYAGAALWPEPAGEGGGYQTTTMTYDGHGRLHTQHLPSYDPDAVATYEYNDDDTVRSVTDPRGVVTDFTYNGRHQTTRVAYDPKQSGAPDTPDVTFAYDAAGNRKAMTDGAGSLTYHYDALSRLDSETRQFSGLNRSHDISYEYTLSNDLKRIVDPFGGSISYTRDSAGLITDVTAGGGYTHSRFNEWGQLTETRDITQFAINIQHRAWGARKSATFETGRTVSVNYNARLQLSHFRVDGQPFVAMDKSYEYYGNGQLRYAQDHMDAKQDRSYEYDQVGRLQLALSGA